MLTLLSSAIETANSYSAVYETKRSLVGGYLHVYAFIDSKLYGKALLDIKERKGCLCVVNACLKAV